MGVVHEMSRKVHVRAFLLRLDDLDVGLPLPRRHGDRHRHLMAQEVAQMDGNARQSAQGTQIKLLAHRLVEIARAGAHERGEVRICYTDRHTRTRAGERTVAKSKYTEELAHQIIERMIDGESVDGAREGQGAVRGPACRR
jgi:hypothetical protein